MMRSSWVEWTLDPVTEVLIRGRKGDRVTQERK